MNGLKKTRSNCSVTETTNRMVALIKKKGWHIFARINHAKEALKKGLVLRPTELLLFGNPEIGTLLMQDRQVSAIDLPMKALVWEAEDGRVYITFNDVAWLKKRHGLTDIKTIAKIAKVIENVCQAGANKE